MIDFLPFLKIAPIFFVALVSPGPDFVLVSSLSLSRGRMAGIQGAIGVAAGITVYVMLTVWGLAALFEQIHWLMLTVKILGGCYLFYLGVNLWRCTFKNKTETTEKTPKVSHKNACYMGLLTNLTNPKAVAFFSSVFALVLTPDTNNPTKITTTILCALMAVGWFSFVAIALSTPRIRAPYERWQRTIDRTAGTIIGFFGLELLYSSFE